MNEAAPTNPSVSPPLAGIVAQAVAETGVDPANVAQPGAGGGAAGFDPSGQPVRPVVDPALVEKTCVQLLRLVERAGARSLYGQALRATGGDKEFAGAVAAQWAWSEAEILEVGALARATAELYALDRWLRPDVALLLAAGTHAAGYFIASGAIRQRAKESAELSKQAEPAKAS